MTIILPCIGRGLEIECTVHLATDDVSPQEVQGLFCPLQQTRAQGHDYNLNTILLLFPLKSFRNTMT